MTSELRVTGFQTVTTEFAEDRPSLDEPYLIRSPSTYVVDTLGASKYFHVRAGDKIIVSRKHHPRHNDLVIAVIHNDFVLARLEFQGGRKVLKPFGAILNEANDEVLVWGVVVAIINNYR